MRAVLDTNVVISGLLTRKGPPSRIVDAWIDGRFEALVSPAIVSEYFEVLTRPKFNSVGSIDERTRILSGLMSLPWTVLVVTENVTSSGNVGLSVNPAASVNLAASDNLAASANPAASTASVAGPLPITEPGPMAPRDASGVRFLECAAAGGAGFIVTGDKHLLELPRQRGFAVVSPAEFAGMIGC